jgi:hypothetical protein
MIAIFHINKLYSHSSFILSKLALNINTTMLVRGHPSRHVPSGRLVPGPAQRSGPVGLLRSPSVRRGFSKKKNTATFPFSTTAHMRPLREHHRGPRPPLAFSNVVALSSGRRAPTPPRCCRAPTLPRCCHAPISRRLPCRTKPGAVSNGGGGGRTMPAPTLMVESPGLGLPHVASVCFKYFKCFVGMFQVFHADIVKVDRDVAYVAMIVHICCKCMFFQTYIASVFIDVAYVSHICCKCFIWMLHMFAIVYQVFFMCCCMCFRRLF